MLRNCRLVPGEDIIVVESQGGGRPAKPVTDIDIALGGNMDIGIVGNDGFEINRTELQE